MRSFWSDPYLWVHLAGIAALPLCLLVCLLGFAAGTPLLPVWLELLLVGAVGILPVLWMQLFRPFDIFSILVVALKPAQLTPDQRRILSLFKTPTHKILSVLVALILAWLLWPLYRWSPVGAALMPFSSSWHLVGLFLSAGAFLAGNLFLQVPVSVARVLLTSEVNFSQVEPYPPEKIQQDFTLFGFQVRKILPHLTPESDATKIVSASGDSQPPSS
jgi:hypothetical protein